MAEISGHPLYFLISQMSKANLFALCHDEEKLRECEPFP